MPLFRNKYRVETTRLKGWDYGTAGRHFVTLCTRNRGCFFGDVVECRMHFSRVGEIAGQYWKDVPIHSPPNIGLDIFVVMPNHVHGIVVIEKPAVETLPVERLQCYVSTATHRNISNLGRRLS